MRWLAWVCRRAWKVISGRPMVAATYPPLPREGARGLWRAIKGREEQGIVRQLPKPEREASLKLVPAMIAQSFDDNIRQTDIAPHDQTGP